jgi:hypothetical protein
MSFFNSVDGNASFEFTYVGSHDVNGNKSFEFAFDVKSHNFSGGVHGIWFEKDDLQSFFGDVEQMTIGSNLSARLIAMSDFELSIHAIDKGGHFEAVFKLSNPLSKNEAKLTVRLETQSVVDFIEAIRRALS